MGELIWAALALGVLGFLGYRAGRVWVDASRRGFPLARRLGWALLGAVVPSRYWWGARIEALSPDERDELLARETEALGLSRADSLRCPLCGAEVPGAWTLTPDGRPTVARGPVECPHCDFRLDACRHCAHFLPGSAQTQGQVGLGSGELTFGRCERYKTAQPVERVCPPEMARQLKARGWETVRSPMAIIDSFVPPDTCTAFAPDRKRLKMGGVRWPDARRAALLRLLSPPSAAEAAGELPKEDEQWLL